MRTGESHPVAGKGHECVKNPVLERNSHLIASPATCRVCSASMSKVCGVDTIQTDDGDVFTGELIRRFTVMV
jgi:hypothetical protein